MCAQYSSTGISWIYVLYYPEEREKDHIITCRFRTMIDKNEDALRGAFFVALFPLELTQRPRLKDTQADKEYLQRLKNSACNSLRFGETDFVTLQNQKIGVFLRSDERVRWLLQDAEGSFGSF